METNESKDLRYCYNVLEALKDLEDNVYQRNELERKREKKSAKRRSILAGIIALILPIDLWFFFLHSEMGERHLQSFYVNTVAFLIRSFGLLALTVFLFLFVYLFIVYLYETRLFAPLKGLTEKDLNKHFQMQKRKVNSESEEILNREILVSCRIPNRYLSIEMISKLTRFFLSGQATFLEAAVYMLDMELENSKYYKHLIPSVTLIGKTKEQLKKDEQH